MAPESGRYSHLLTTLSCWTVKATVGEVLVGGYAWAYLTFVDGDWAYIDDVAVHANHQGQGVGTALIDNIATWLHESGVETITGFAKYGRMARIFAKHQITAGVPRSGPTEPQEARHGRRQAPFHQRSSVPKRGCRDRPPSREHPKPT